MQCIFESKFNVFLKQKVFNSLKGCYQR